MFYRENSPSASTLEKCLVWCFNKNKQKVFPSLSLVLSKMGLLLKAITIFGLAVLIKGQDTRPLNGHNPEDIQTQPSILAILQSPDATGLPAPSLPLNLELPKEERGIPFYTPEEDSLTLLKAPSASAFLPPAADFNPQYPVPSQELQLPSLEPWNPNNDPKLYYELPAAVTKYEEPTNVYPKKYNKLVHEKDKPLGGRPKQEVNLIPISEQEYQNKQKNINKVLSNLAKAENQKLVETEKSQQTIQV